ncbi:MAG: chromosomal replication initiator protein DnaA [Treponema sp.]|nr:chromosomal replication initiator protein DnaA [Treponema sp.]
MADLDYEGFWKETLVHLQNDLGEEVFSGWFSDIKYLRAQIDEQSGKTSIVIGVPSPFHRDKVNSLYQSNINSKLSELSGIDLSLEMDVIGKQAKKSASSSQSSDKNDTSSASSAEKTQKVKEKRGKHPQMRDDYTFDRYVIGENNKYAANAALAICKNPGKICNPFLIYGGVGLGKTHLMQSIGNSIHDNSDSRVICITSENFLNEYIEGIGQNKMNVFRNKYRQADVLLIDDIQFLTDKPGVQDELFHTFNALLDAKKQLVFTCDRPIEDLKKFEERLISRFGLGIKADLQPPRYEERCAILKSVAQAHGVSFPDEVIDLMGKNIASNVRDLISALNNLIKYAELMGEKITLEAAQKHLKNIFNAPRQANLSMDNIIRVSSEYFGLTPNDLKGKKRSQNIVFARQLAMYIGREMTDNSMTEIGQDFGGRDHTTVIHSIDKIKGKLITDPTLESTIENLKRAIKEYGAKH